MVCVVLHRAAVRSALILALMTSLMVCVVLHPAASYRVHGVMETRGIAQTWVRIPVDTP